MTSILKYAVAAICLLPASGCVISEEGSEESLGVDVQALEAGCPGKGDITFDNVQGLNGQIETDTEFKAEACDPQSGQPLAGAFAHVHANGQTYACAGGGVLGTEIDPQCPTLPSVIDPVFGAVQGTMNINSNTLGSGQGTYTGIFHTRPDGTKILSSKGVVTEGTAAGTVVNWTTILPPSFNLLLLNGLVEHVGDGLLLATAP